MLYELYNLLNHGVYYNTIKYDSHKMLYIRFRKKIKHH